MSRHASSAAGGGRVASAGASCGRSAALSSLAMARIAGDAQTGQESADGLKNQHDPKDPGERGSPKIPVRPDGRSDQNNRNDRQGAGGQPGRRSPKTRLPGLLANLAYPLVILAAWRWLDARYTGGILFALLCVQRYAGRGRVAGSLRRLTALEWTVAGALSMACAAIALTGSDLLLRLYPLLVNLGLLAAFGATLVRGPSMIEKFARLAHGECDAHVVRYTRRVTWVWCAFFALNGAFSAYTALYCTRGAWSLYNGLIAYGLMGALIVGELAWRKVAQRARRARGVGDVGDVGHTGNIAHSEDAARTGHPHAHRQARASRPEVS